MPPLKTIILLFALLCPEAASAETIVLLGESDTDAVIYDIARATNRSLDDLLPTRWSTLRERGTPQMEGSGVILHCTASPASTREIDDLLSEAEGAQNYGQLAEALVLLRSAEERLGCLTEHLDPATAARIFFLTGVLAAKAETDGQAAYRSFLRALVFEPHLTWGDEFPSEWGQDWFDSARRSLEQGESAGLRLAVRPERGSLFVDGREISPRSQALELRPGRHLLQTGINKVTTVWVELGAATESIALLPASAPDDILGWLYDSERWGDLSNMLAATLDPEAALFVAHRGQVWQGRAGSPSWTEIRLPRSSTSRVLTWSGAGVFTAGAVASSILYAWGKNLSNACIEDSQQDLPETCADNELSYQSLRSLLPFTEGLALAGVAMAGGGLLVNIGPSWMPRGGLLLGVRVIH